MKNWNELGMAEQKQVKMMAIIIGVLVVLLIAYWVIRH